MRSVFLHLPKALAGDAKAIHQVRVAARRLRVALPLLAQKPEGRRVKRACAALRELVRIAGGSRDLDVGAEILANYHRDAKISGAGPAMVRRHLRQARARSRTRMAEGLLDLEIARLRRDLRAILLRGPDDIFTVSRRLGQVRDEKGAAVTHTLAALGGRFAPEALHQLRIRARQLRYTAELGQALRGQAKQSAALWKGLQERLGAVNDRYVLAAWLTNQSARALTRGRTDLAGEARRARAAILRASRAQHRAFRDSNPEAIVHEALSGMGQREPGPAAPPVDAGRGSASLVRPHPARKR